jgi:hypothetical protein
MMASSSTPGLWSSGGASALNCDLPSNRHLGEMSGRVLTRKRPGLKANRDDNRGWCTRDSGTPGCGSLGSPHPALMDRPIRNGADQCFLRAASAIISAIRSCFLSSATLWAVLPARFIVLTSAPAARRISTTRTRP